LTECYLKDIIGKKTIIIGDIGAGKTALTRRLLDEAILEDVRITVLDFAPAEKTINGVKIGGHLYDGIDINIRNLKSDLIKTPRISAENAEELISMANFNEKITSTLIREFIDSPTDTLFINDVSIHLQQGNLKPLLDAIKLARTVVVNGYIGKRLREDIGSGVSSREINLMRRLSSKMDCVIKLEGGEEIVYTDGLCKKRCNN
jgi:hypothetical protein